MRLKIFINTRFFSYLHVLKAPIYTLALDESYSPSSLFFSCVFSSRITLSPICFLFVNDRFFHWSFTYVWLRSLEISLASFGVVADLCDANLRSASNWLAPSAQPDYTLPLFFPETHQVFVIALGSGLKEHRILAIGSGLNTIIK